MNSLHLNQQIGKIATQLQGTWFATGELFSTFYYKKKAAKKEIFIPNATALMPDGQSYFEMVGNNKITTQTIARWQLLEQLASRKEGQFYIFAPSSQIDEIEQTMEAYHIEGTLTAY